MASPQTTFLNGFVYPPGRSSHTAVSPVEKMASAGPILLVSADKQLCSLAADYLSERNFAHQSAHDGTSGLASALTGEYAVIVVDAMLPVLDGFGLIAELRTRSSVPVLLVGSTEEQCIAARDTGADDFILKPFGSGEFLARVKVLERRGEKANAKAETVIECHELRVDVRNHQAWLGEELLLLTNIEFAILKCLVRNMGRVVSRDELAAVLYQRRSTPFERSIDVHISHLRKKIERAGGISIRTMRGVGYLLTTSSH